MRTICSPAQAGALDKRPIERSPTVILNLFQDDEMAHWPRFFSASLRNFASLRETLCCWFRAEPAEFRRDAEDNCWLVVQTQSGRVNVKSGKMKPTNRS